MPEWIQWCGRFENSKILALLRFFVTLMRHLDLYLHREESFPAA